MQVSGWMDGWSESDFPRNLLCILIKDKDTFCPDTVYFYILFISAVSGNHHATQGFVY